MASEAAEQVAAPAESSNTQLTPGIDQALKECGWKGGDKGTRRSGGLHGMMLANKRQLEAPWQLSRRSVLLAVVPLLASSLPLIAASEESFMAQSANDYGVLNPKAAPELSRFAFLIGSWKCEAKLLSADGIWQMFKAAWLGRYILDGYAIADEYRMFSPSGEVIVLGMNFRTYDAAKRTWNIRWLNGLAGDWTDLVSQELGGLKSHGPSITYAFHEPVAGHAYTQATYTAHSATHFTWRGQKSDDAKNWNEFMIVEAHRDK